MRRDVFQAIADPTRREIIALIAHRPLNVNAVAGNFDVSRTAVYKHMKILTECGLITIKKQGRERYCEARLDKLNEVEAKQFGDPETLTRIAQYELAYRMQASAPELMDLSGESQATIDMYELERTGGRYGLVSLCIGGGQGIASIFERLD